MDNWCLVDLIALALRPAALGLGVIKLTNHIVPILLLRSRCYVVVRFSLMYYLGKYALSIVVVHTTFVSMVFVFAIILGS